MYRKTEYKDAGVSIFDQLDQDRIIAEINASENRPLAGFEQDIVIDMLWAVVEKWLARDTDWLQPTAVEERFEWVGESGVIDLAGIFTMDAPSALQSKKFIRDWKSSQGQLDARWAARYANDWQWKMYLYHFDADVFVYSGVNKDGDVREIVLQRPENLGEMVRTQLAGLTEIRDVLVKIGLEVYPANMPQACNAFGRECVYFNECRDGAQPRKALEAWNWSPTAMKTFLLCPERFRRDRLERLAGTEKTTPEELAIGEAFHRAIAEVYRQVWGIS